MGIWSAVIRVQSTRGDNMEQERFTFSVGGLTVYEGDTAFYLSNGQREVCIGDGVDMFSTLDGKSIPVGSKRFYELMRRWLASDVDEIATAYGLD